MIVFILFKVNTFYLYKSKENHVHEVAKQL